MTKLEKKLEKLGYNQDCQRIYLYFKHTPMCTIYAYLNKNRTKCDLQLDNVEPINNEEELNSLFQSYNIMKKDLEELEDMNKIDFKQLKKIEDKIVKEGLDVEGLKKIRKKLYKFKDYLLTNEEWIIKHSLLRHIKDILADERS